MSDVRGRLPGGTGDTGDWKPIAAVLQPDGTYALKVDTELVLDSGNISISNLKVGSTDQTANTLRYLKVLDDGTLVVQTVSLDLLEGYKVARTVDSGAYPRYYGLVNEEEDWVIIRESLAGTEKIYEYFAGSGNFTTAWTNRVGHAYAEYYTTF